jgi:methylisocitrate lyase
MNGSAGTKFRCAVRDNSPLKIVGTINAYCAKMAEATGFKALYLSGAGVANASFALPDLGITSLNDVCEDAQRITAASELPLLVDIDTGFGSALGISHTIKKLSRAGVAAVHIEDQVTTKRCGHRPGKKLVNSLEMQDRLKIACDSREDDSFVIMARTDAYSNEGLHGAIERALAYVEAGADMIFAEAIHKLDDFKKFTEAVNVPILANMTEFGQTPYLTEKEFQSAGLAMVLYPLSAFRAMNAAALSVYEDIFQNGTQVGSLDAMQTREALYKTLDYHKYEKIIDKLHSSERKT